MRDLIAACICLAVALTMLVLRKAYLDLPVYELKRRAARGDQFAKAVYPAIAYPAFRGFLWLIMVIASSAGIILLNRELPLWLGIVPAVVWLWLVFSWMPNRRVSNFSQRSARWLAPSFAWFTPRVYPLLRQLERLQRRYLPTHTKLYEPEDLRTFLQHQARQIDNRISEPQLTRLFKLIDFDQALVRDYCCPWKRSLKLLPDDLIGPKLLDEMHRSRQSAFAVVKTKSGRQVIGQLNKSAVGLHSEGKVSDYMVEGVDTIAEDETIEHAINQFALGASPLLMVVDKEGDSLGTLTLKEAIKALLEIEDPRPPGGKQTAAAEDKPQLEEAPVS